MHLNSYAIFLYLICVYIITLHFMFVIGMNMLLCKLNVNLRDQREKKVNNRHIVNILISATKQHT